MKVALKGNGFIWAILLITTLVSASCARGPAPLTTIPTAMPSPTPAASVETPAMLSTPSGVSPALPSPQPTAIPTVPPQEGKPLTSAQSAFFAGSGVCRVCHTRLTDGAGRDVSIAEHWRSTMMANAARDPFWQAKVSSEVARFPELAEVIQDKCSTCHMPLAHAQAMAEGSPTLVFDGFIEPQHPLYELAMDGVSCTLCHQIMNRNLGQPEAFSGRYPIDTAVIIPNRIAFGPFPNPMARGMMRRSSGFFPEYGPQTLDSGLCATCHTLYTPYVDARGNVAGEFPEQTPYLEWEHSDYGDGIGEDKSCQDCHMPQAEGAVVISNMPRNLAPRSPFAQHHFVGGNVMMLRLLQAHVAELGLTASTERFQATIVRTLEQLKANTASLDITEARIEGDTLAISTRVENKTGHKFPTGYPSRRAWIHLKVTDARGKVVFESGKPNPDGSIIGCDADADPTAYEPHYDLITTAEQVQVYEAVMQDTDGKVTYVLLRGSGYVKDNRLLPVGFDKVTAPSDIAVQGEAAGDENFTGGADMVSYLIDVAGYTGPFLIEAELLYQSLAYPFVQDLLAADTDYVKEFTRYYEASDKAPIVIATVQMEIK